MEISRKKRNILIVTMILMFCFIFFYYANCTHGFYTLKIKAECISNNSVGNEWEKIYKMDGKIISNEIELLAPLDNQEIKIINVTITEIDKYCDSSTKDIAIKIDHKETAEQIITVVENNGKYKGNTAKWKVTVSVKRTGKVWLIK